MVFIKRNYLPKEKEETLKLHKYCGEDHSILYNHVFAPLAEFSVKFTPEWLAPNTITLIGLLFIIMPYLVIMYYSTWNLQNYVPSWVYWFTFVCHFTYFHLDNMDGKQARKTGNSSPLGLIFDHGCDALSVYFQAVTIINCMRMGNDIWGITTLFTPSITFFISNLEEYYTHKLYLPIINPAIEGVVVTGFLIMASAIIGQDGMTTLYTIPYLSEIFGTLPLGKWLASFVHIGAALGTPFIFIRIYRAVGFNKLLEAFYNCWYMLLSHGTILYFVLYSEEHVAGMRWAILLLMFNMCKTLTFMLLCSSSKAKYSPFFPSNVVIILAFLVNTYCAVNKMAHLPEIPFLLFLCLASALNYFHFITNVSDQLCKILNIKCFQVKPKTKQN